MIPKQTHVRLTLIDRLAIGFAVLHGIAGTLVAVHRHWQFETGYYDFGIFDRAIFLVSRFQAPVVDHLAIGGKVILADHVSPIIFLLSPLYWFTQRSEIILMAQAIIVSASVLLLYALGKLVVKNDFVSFAVSFAYALFIGIQNTVITDFHEVSLLTLPLVLLFFSIEKNRKIIYVASLLLVLLVKENMALLGISIGIFLWVFKKSWKGMAILTALLSLGWWLAATGLILPYFSENMAQYTPTIPQTPLGVISAFLDHPIKRETLVNGFGSFLFLPLFYPPLWPALIQELASRFFLAQSTLRWSLSLHYGAAMGTLSAISTLYALNVLMRKFPHQAWFPACIAALLLGLSVYNHRFRFHGPMGLAYNPAFYRHSKNFGFLTTLIERVPQGATVMTQNNLAAHFTHQPVMLFRADYTPFMPEYIVFDLRDGQNPNNLFPQNQEKLMGLRSKLTLDPDYRSIYKTQDQEIFEKIKY